VQPVLTPEEMGDADRRAVAAGTPVAVLMERAGRAVAWAVRAHLGRTYGVRAVIACGKGNNGGDGLVAARVLAGWGVRVEVLRIGTGLDSAHVARAVARADVAVDAMYGTGFRGALDGDARQFAEATATVGVPVVAVDVPSGVDGLTGAVTGVTVRADRTVTFAALKPGLLFEPGRSLAGAVTVADIGIAVDPPAGAPPTGCTGSSDVATWVPPRAPDAHKWASATYVVGGSAGMTGAPALTARAALHSGSGMVWCGVPGDAAAVAGGEVIAVALSAGPGGGLGEPAVEAVLADVGRFGALAVGPGLGRDPATLAAVRRLVLAAPVPVVLDADGLHAFAGDAAALRARSAPTVCTPHGGEYAALTGSAPGADRLAATRALAAASGAVVLLKGPGTVVADPTGRAAVCPLGSPALATAGTGDVLTGIVAAFLARGADAFGAAAAGAWVHAAAAEVAGHTVLVAGDLVGSVPVVLDSL